MPRRVNNIIRFSLNSAGINFRYSSMKCLATVCHLCAYTYNVFVIVCGNGNRKLIPTLRTHGVEFKLSKEK